MKPSRSTVIIGVFYIIGAIMIIPILSYYLGINYVFPQQAYIQIYLSGPLLIVFGLLLFFFYKKRLIGGVFFILGLWWLLSVFYELLTK